MGGDLVVYGMHIRVFVALWIIGGNGGGFDVGHLDGSTARNSNESYEIPSSMLQTGGVRVRV